MNKNDQCSRREFVSSVGKSVLTLAVITPALGLHAMAKSKPAPDSSLPVTLDITKPEYQLLALTGGALKIPDPNDAKKPMIVIRTSETTVAAFSSRCTHLGCEVHVPKNNILTCPCHDSVFDTNGKAIRGPAKKNLHSYSATLEGTIITIKETPESSDL